MPENEILECVAQDNMVNYNIGREQCEVPWRQGLEQNS